MLHEYPMPFIPNLDILPDSQRTLWPELRQTPEMFTLYGGTALALRLGHRTSLDFDFFSNASFDPEELSRRIPYLKDSEPVQVKANTLTCRMDRGGPVLISFFGDLGLGQVGPRDRLPDMPLHVASLLDLAGTKVAVVQKRAEAKDYIDIDALLQQGTSLATMLAAGTVIYGCKFNPLITVKALSFFNDVAGLPGDVQRRITAAVAAIDVTRLPVLRQYVADAPPESVG